MIDAHPDFAIPPETGFLSELAKLTEAQALDPEAVADLVTNYPVGAPAWPDFGLDAAEFRRRLEQVTPLSAAAAARTFYAMYATGHGRPRWGDKTPLYGRHMPAIERLLPEAHFIHIIRDGRDVALSLRGLWFSPSDDIATLAAYWRDNLTIMRREGAACRNYLEVRYEDLVRAPRRTLEGVCALVAAAFDKRMLHYSRRAPERLSEHGPRMTGQGETIVTRERRLHQQALTTAPPQPSRIAAWRRTMTAEERRTFGAVAGELLAELGYEV